MKRKPATPAAKAFTNADLKVGPLAAPVSAPGAGAAEPAGYLSAQLNAWRQGTRKNDPNDLMGHIARAMTDDEVQAVAEYFAGLEHKGGSQ